MEEYRIPAGPSEAELVEKKSRFIGQVFPAETEEEARACIEAVRKKHYDARHHCFCYRLANGTVRASDDGEPQGTAGQPMLAVFDRENVQNVVCVVTRYFGGILLGAGGLTRAYTKTAKWHSTRRASRAGACGTAWISHAAMPFWSGRGWSWPHRAARS